MGTTASTDIPTQCAGLLATLAARYSVETFIRLTGGCQLETSTMSNDIARRILEHFQKGGTLNDNAIDALYRLAHGLGPEVKTEIKTVERWAYDAATRLHLKAAVLNKTAQTTVYLSTRFRK
jgi:DNA repair protein RadC